MALNPNAERMKKVGYDAETLDLVEQAMQTTLTPARQAEIKREEQQREAAKLRQERLDLLAMADRAIEGKDGPEARQLALELTAETEGGRSDFNLGRLRKALQRLK